MRDADADAVPLSASLGRFKGPLIIALLSPPVAVPFRSDYVGRAFIW